MRILITGSRGQLGSQLISLGGSEHQLYGYDLDMDITDAEKVKTEFARVEPQAVIHCAAYTDVDGCEDRVQFTYDVNTTGTENLVREAKKYDADFLFISSDYVFDGNKGSPYLETDQAHPLSVYGDSKYRAEKLVAEITDRHYIVRTTGIYSKYGKNFVDTVIKAARKKSSLSIVDDQVCTPTFSLDLARCIYALIGTRVYGIYHATNAGQCSWYQFTRYMLDIMGIDTQLEPVRQQADWPAKPEDRLIQYCRTLIWKKTRYALCVPGRKH
ncbi:MAG: dTDP-4-dehydrorhamnose reductase [Actinomycetota bacterium]|nr:dTDP-4-dehydrorhamnose reductase [Actinomycetota bacterium]